MNTEIRNIFELVREINKEKIMERGNYLIGSITNNGGISFAEYPKVHKNQTDAKIEAERLARLNPSKKFLVVMVAGTVIAQGVQWN